MLAEAGQAAATGPLDSPPGGGTTIDLMADDLLPIGMFSRATSLSIKALRAYHESGLLVPAAVDPRTGYRNYTVDQLADAAVIVRLRSLDLPLEQVRRVLAARDPALTRRVLDEHRLTMQARLDTTERIVAELQHAVTVPAHTPVHWRDDPARHTVRIRGRVRGEQFGPWLGWAFGRLGEVLERAGVPPAGPCGGLYAAELIDEEPELVEAFIPIAAPFTVPAGEHEVAIGEVPAARVANLVHLGGYDSIGDTYLALGAWVARHAEHAAAPVREWYLVGPTEAADPAAYRTEISWPIRPGSTPTP